MLGRVPLFRLQQAFAMSFGSSGTRSKLHFARIERMHMYETLVHSPSREVLELIVSSRGEKCLSTTWRINFTHFVRLRRAVRTLSLRFLALRSLSLRFLALRFGEIQSHNGMR